MKNEENKKKKRKHKPYSLLVKENKKGRHIIKFLNFLRAIVIPVYYLLKPFKFYGNRKIKDGACVYVVNHYTLFDAVYPASTTWEGIHFIAKKEVVEAPVLGAIARGVKIIPVNRDGSDVRALLECFKCLNNNQKIAVFPEGTRNKSGEGMLPFKHGATLMATRTKTPIIPIVIYKKPRFFRCTHILIGDPLELTEYYDRKLTQEEAQQADDRLREHMIAMREAHTQYLLSKKKRKNA